MVRRGSLGLIAGAVLLALLGMFLLTWSLVAGVVVLVLSVASLPGVSPQEARLWAHRYGRVPPVAPLYRLLSRTRGPK